ncbi:hypothetical protein E2C01_081249 [Portunus trituberculatus]|uniref:Uncharacterized protein n=1 Tax=Portunus trituberculatus TaxID=210409 RepID=A0A5B7IVS2_PORTR|nr:hypothetical protein [Portunus trituberculatus]
MNVLVSGPSRTLARPPVLYQHCPSAAPPALTLLLLHTDALTS